MRLRTATGHWIEAPFDAFLEQSELPVLEDASFPYLRLVDPYADTVFSRLQMAAVIPELERLAAAVPSPRIQSVLQLARRCSREDLSYLVFVGD
ncbi:MAG: hypothetical protein WD830_04730 [Chloroflexota bacterium]